MNCCSNNRKKTATKETSREDDNRNEFPLEEDFGGMKRMSVKQKRPEPRTRLVDLSSNCHNNGEGDEAGFNLKRYVHDRILKEIFDNGVEAAGDDEDPCHSNRLSKDASRSFGLYVMVLDNMGTGILGSCLKLHDLGTRRVSVVENLEMNRHPFPGMEGIYFIAPTEKSIIRLIEDFKSPCEKLYKGAHVFFTGKCAEHLFEAITESPVAAYIMTLKELNVGFFAEESHVFDFNMKDNFFDLFSPVATEVKQQKSLETLGDKILTLCQTLQLFPTIHYQSSPKSFGLALFVQSKLEEENKATLGALSSKTKPGEVVLLIVDRSIDVVTPLLHCMSLQGMVNDVMQIENNCFQFEHMDSRGKMVTKTVILDEEEDSLWREIRHMHVADVAQQLPIKFQTFLQEQHIIRKEKPTLKDMAEITKAFPQFHKEMSQFAIHMHLTDVCMQRYKKGLQTVVLAEQNIATGINGSNGTPITQFMPFMAPILTETKRSNLEKTRLLLLYIILKNGLPENDIDKILDHSTIPLWYKTYVINMSFLGVNILTRRKTGHNKPPARPRAVEGGYTSARWEPYVKDLMEDLINMELDQDKFNVLENQGRNFNKKGKGAKKTAEPPKPVKPSKVIVVFVGGITYPEMAAAYQVSAATGVDVLIGGDEILTPTTFLSKIQNLKRWSHFGECPDEVKV